MAEATRTVTTTKRYEYTMRNPVDHVEVGKALHWASRDFEEVRGRPVEFADDLWVGGDEEKVVVYFEAEPIRGRE